MAKRQAGPAAGVPEGIFIVGPSGAVHEATSEHARARIAADRRFRYATEEEIAAYRKAGGYQTHERPLAERWAPPE